MPKLPFHDFLEHAQAVTSKGRRLHNKEYPAKDCILPPWENTHVFYMGHEDTVRELGRKVVSDIMQETRERVPIPFRDVTIVSAVPKKFATDMDVGWIADRIIEGSNYFEGREDPEITNMKEFEGDTDWRGMKDISIRQRVLIVRYDDVTNWPIWWPVWYRGSHDGALAIQYDAPHIPKAIWAAAPYRSMSKERLAQAIGAESAPILEQLALISHPMNYTVKISPKLKLKEERRVARGKRIHAGKRPHFIVLDHEILTRLHDQVTGGGTHATPVPHHRRGHWRRLAARCRHARMLGQDRTFVQPAFVGDKKFGDDKNLYEVLSA